MARQRGLLEGVAAFTAFQRMTDLANAQGSGTGFDRLESLSISGFRGIGQLTIPRLGRVTLIAGKNGVGKTTVLEALSVYAARGRLQALREILVRRDEWTSDSDGQQGGKEIAALDRLFHQDEHVGTSISVGPAHGGPVFEMQDIDDFSAIPTEIADGIFDTADTDEPRVLRVAFGTVERFYVGYDIGQLRVCKGQRSETFGNPIKCRWIGPQIISNRQLARLWDQVVRENLESLALDALRLVYGNEVERAPVMIGDGSDRDVDKRGDGSGRSVGRRAVVKLRHRDLPVPLRSLGDGATRILSVVLALANSRGGILLVDEVENGIHYSLQSKFWSMVLQAAEAHNTQVLATTHSKDCIDGFADAASASPDIDANLVRIGWRDGKLRAVDYSIEDLEAVAEQNFEVR